MIKKTIRIILLSFFVMNSFAQNAAEILDKAAAVYKNSKGINATFVFKTYSKLQKASESFEGSINMKDNKFTLTTPDISTWYNGKTQWTYVDQTEEVNISNPKEDELLFTNPAILISSYKNNFDPKYKGESTGVNGKVVYTISLTPKKKSDIVIIELQIEKNSSLPVSIIAESKNGVSNSIQINKIKTGSNQPDTFFEFKKADFPNAEIIDLR